MNQQTLPLKLPWCVYPTCAEIEQHGLFDLPKNLPLVALEKAKKYRSTLYTAEEIKLFGLDKLLELTGVMADSFAVNEPMNRHVNPPKGAPDFLKDVSHCDAFGTDTFRQWSKKNIVFWFIRLFVLTDPTSPFDALCVNRSMLDLSLAIKDKEAIIGGAFNVPVFPATNQPLRQDLFIDAVMTYMHPFMNLIFEQEHEAIEALNKKYPDFRKAYTNGKVGMHFMIARSAKLPVEHTFELVAASVEQFQQKGYEYMVVTASNQWTGAACEVLNSVKVHFLPHRDKKRIANELEASGQEVYSKEGYISNKDSGLMFYV